MPIRNNRFTLLNTQPIGASKLPAGSNTGEAPTRPTNDEFDRTSPVEPLISPPAIQDLIFDLPDNPSNTSPDRPGTDEMLTDPRNILIDAPGNIDSILDSKGLNKNKPEIIALTDFVPGYRSPAKSELPLHKLLRYQLSLRQLSVDSWNIFFTKLKQNIQTKDLVTNLLNDVKNTETRTKREVAFLQSIYSSIEQIKKSLDVRNTSTESSLNQFDNFLQNDRPTSEEVSLISLLQNDLQFSSENIENFSNSKMVLQLLSDLNQTLKKHSPSLFGGGISTRANDIDTFKIISDIIDQTRTFSFDVSQISSRTTSVSLSSDRDKFKSFILSLPQNSNDKIKLLNSLLSKELRVSAGLAALENTLLDRRYQLSSTNVLLSIMGNITSSPLDIGVADFDLMSLIKVIDTDGNTVLPFEQRVIVNGQKTFIPGSVYFADSITQSDIKYNLEPLSDYVQKSTENIDNVTLIINRLLNLTDSDKKLHHRYLFDKEIADLKRTLTTISAREQISEENAICIALMNASLTDSTLHFYLFQYFCLITQPQIFNQTDRQVDLDSLDLSSVINKIVDRIKTRYQRTLSIQNNDRLSSDYYILHLFEQSLKSCLQSSSPLQLFRGFGTIFDDFIEKASNLSTNTTGNTSNYGFYLSDGSHRTRFNSLTNTTLKCVFFEIMIALYSKHTSVKFVEAATNKIKIIIDLAANQRKSLEINRLNTEFDRPGQDNLGIVSDELIQMSYRLEREDTFVSDALKILNAMISRIKNAYANAVGFFNTTLNDDKSRNLTALANSAVGKDVLKLLSGEQLQICWQKHAEFVDIIQTRTLLQDEISLKQKNVKNLFDFLQSPENMSPSADNLRILSIGLPAGMINSLRYPIYQVNESLNIRSSTKRDIIKIDVFRKDLEFDGVIFKPQTFFFDMSLYSYSLDNAEQSFLKRFGCRDFRYSGEKGSLNFADFMNSSDYSFLKIEQRESLYKNHINSYLLWLYLYFIAGINLDTADFVFHDELLTFEVDGRAHDVFADYNILGQTRDVLFANPPTADVGLFNFDRGTRDVNIGFDVPNPNNIFRLSESEASILHTFLSSYAFTSDNRRQRIISPKQFERIFHIPVDPDKFEIDVEQTMTTTVGRASLNSLRFQDRTQTNLDINGGEIITLRERSRLEGQLSLSEIFATVNLAGDK